MGKVFFEDNLHVATIPDLMSIADDYLRHSPSDRKGGEAALPNFNSVLKLDKVIGLEVGELPKEVDQRIVSVLFAHHDELVQFKLAEDDYLSATFPYQTRPDLSFRVYNVRLANSNHMNANLYEYKPKQHQYRFVLDFRHVLLISITKEG